MAQPSHHQFSLFSWTGHQGSGQELAGFDSSFSRKKAADSAGDASSWPSGQDKALVLISTPVLRGKATSEGHCPCRALLNLKWGKWSYGKKNPAMGAWEHIPIPPALCHQAMLEFGVCWESKPDGFPQDSFRLLNDVSICCPSPLITTEQSQMGFLSNRWAADRCCWRLREWKSRMPWYGLSLAWREKKPPNQQVRLGLLVLPHYSDAVEV